MQQLSRRRECKSWDQRFYLVFIQCALSCKYESSCPVSNVPVSNIVSKIGGCMSIKRKAWTNLWLCHFILHIPAQKQSLNSKSWMVSSHGGLKTDQTCLIKTSLPGSDQRVVYFGCWLVAVSILCLDERSPITYLRNQIKQRRRRVLDHSKPLTCHGCHGYTRVNFFWPV